MSTSAGLLSPGDREAAIAVLQQRLSNEDIRRYLKSLQGDHSEGRSVEWIVADAESNGQQRTARLRSKLPDEELAAFLVDFAGLDLLSNREIRKILALRATAPERDELHEFPSQIRGRGGPESVARAIADRRWHPGKRWARHLTQVLGFPPSFAGLPGSPTEPDSIDIQPFRPLPDLEHFQSELLRPIREVIAGPAGRNRAILTLPTGAGKTRTAVEAVLSWRLGNPEPGTVLWIAQSEELCEQAVQAFREVWIDYGHRDVGVRDTLTISRLWGAGRNIMEEADVVVASIQKLHAIYSEDEGAERREELASLAAGIKLVIVDEAHRMLAPSYSQVLEFLGVTVGKAQAATVPLLGLTATPFRGAEDETRALALRFHGRLIRPASLSADDPVGDLRGRGVLSHPEHEVLQYGAAEIILEENSQYREYYERFRDFHPDLLAELGEESRRNRQIIDRMCQLPPDWPVLFFGCSVEHATA